MRHTVAIVLIFSLISSCNWLQQAERASPNISKIANCPQPPSELPLIKVNDRANNIYNAFNYQIEKIVADPDTIAFKSSEHKFTWCRANNSWIVESFDKPQSDLTNNTKPGSKPKREIQFKGDIYQYRVKLNRQNPREASQAVFELISPKFEESRRILYTLEQTKQADAGIQLGDPEISDPLIYGNRLFWYVYTYYGEGFGGIATIVSYNPATEVITVIQPPEIATQIINDLAIAGNPDDPTFWIATQLTGEGNPYIPSMGLVAYRPENENYTQGSLDSYRVDNSPIVGAIPTKLYLENEILWVGTGNGICQIDWQAIDREDSWSCWRFALMAELPREELPVYSSLLDNSPDTTIAAKATEPTVEVLWWSLKQREPLTGRYEIEYQPGMTVEFSDRGATTWTELYRRGYQPPVWRPPVYWVGSNWHWDGDRFVRGLDEVELNLFGGGAMGIGSNEPNDDYIFDHNAIRGDLELLKLTKDASEVKHYSAWVEETLLQPYLTIVPHRRSPQMQPNPLLEIKSTLK